MMPAKKVAAEEAYATTAQQFRNDEIDPVEVLNDYELRLWGDSQQRAMFIMAAREWRQDVDERLVRLEELLAELRDKTTP
jgi:hypothetical protein